MKQSIIITALLALALTACNKEEGDTTVVPTPEVAPAPADTMAPAPDAMAPADDTMAPADTMAPTPEAMAPADTTMAPADAMAPADGETPAPGAE